VRAVRQRFAPPWRGVHISQLCRTIVAVSATYGRPTIVQRPRTPKAETVNPRGRGQAVASAHYAPPSAEMGQVEAARSRTEGQDQSLPEIPAEAMPGPVEAQVHGAWGSAGRQVRRAGGGEGRHKLRHRRV